MINDELRGSRVLVIGGNNRILRFIYINGNIIADEILEVASAERQELVLIDEFFKQNDLRIEDIDQFIVLQSSQFRTSFRVIAAILKTFAWILNKGFQMIKVQDVEKWIPSNKLS